MPVKVPLDRLPVDSEHTRPEPCKPKHGRSKCEMTAPAFQLISVRYLYRFSLTLCILGRLIFQYHWECPRGVMVKCDGLQNHSKRVRTPVALLRSLSVKYPWERYEPPYPSSYGLNSTTTVLLGEWLWH